MKVQLMVPGGNFDWQQPPPPQADALTADLGLDTLVAAMAQGDEFLFDVARRGLRLSLRDPEQILYRQAVLADCLAYPDVAREIYTLTVRTLAEEWHTFPPWRSSVDSVLSWAVRVLEVFAAALEQLKRLRRNYGDRMQSEGFRRFFAVLDNEVDDEYLAVVRTHLRELSFPRGALINAQLGRAGVLGELELHAPPPSGWLQQFVREGLTHDGYSFEISPRDQGGIEALGELRGRAANEVANAAGQAADHIRGFFRTLRSELGFYLACLNLHARLTGKGQPVCFPEPVAESERDLAAHGLYDPSLALHLEGAAVGNDADARGRSLLMITGANQGGKSTFLRSLGQAQLMMQAGMFVAAESFRASVGTGLFTHFKREEDVTMTSGKFDEELARMSTIVDQIARGGILLCNESFASTNEQEGSEIGRQVVRALVESGVRVFFVTHLFTLARTFHEDADPANLFMRAERLADGRRTFRVVVGEPEPTSHAEDAYRQIFHEELEPDSGVRPAPRA